MNKKLLIFLIINILSAYTYAENLNISSSIDINNKSYQSVNVSGNLKADKIKVNNNVSVSGDTVINNSSVANISVSGDTTLSNSTTQNLNISGSTKLDNVKINGKVDVSGNMTISHSNFLASTLFCSGNINSNYTTYNATIDLSGNLQSAHDMFDKELNISGDITANDSKINKTITASFNNLKLTNSIVSENIINVNKYKKPVITLVNTQVKGKIIFSKTPGIVIMDSKSKVTKVDNGQIKHN